MIKNAASLKQLFVTIKKLLIENDFFELLILIVFFFFIYEESNLYKKIRVAVHVTDNEIVFKRRYCGIAGINSKFFSFFFSSASVMWHVLYMINGISCPSSMIAFCANYVNTRTIKRAN